MIERPNAPEGILFDDMVTSNEVEASGTLERSQSLRSGFQKDWGILIMRGELISAQTANVMTPQSSHVSVRRMV